MASFLESLTGSKDFTFWLKAKEGKVFLEALPEGKPYFLVEEAKEQFARLVVATNTAGGSLGQRYFENLLGVFEGKIQAPVSVPQAKLLAPQPQKRQSTEEGLLELLQDKKRTVVIFSGKAKLSAFFEEYGEEIEKRGIQLALPETLGLLHQIAAFLKEKGSVLGTTLDFWFRLPKLAFDPNPYLDLPIERLVIMSLPFEVPDDPKLLAFARQLSPAANNFMELSLPRAIFRLRRVIYPILGNSNLREVIILDPRIWQKDYGRAVVDNLQGMELRI